MPRRFGIVPECECSNPRHQRVDEKFLGKTTTDLRSGVMALGNVTAL